MLSLPTTRELGSVARGGRLVIQQRLETLRLETLWAVRFNSCSRGDVGIRVRADIIGHARINM